MLRFFCIAAPLYVIATPTCSSGQCEDRKRSQRSLLQLARVTDYAQQGVREATGVDQSDDLETREDVVDTESSVGIDDAETAGTNANKFQSGGTDFPSVWWTPCQPCEIRWPVHGGGKELEIDIWNFHLEYVKTPRPVVFVFHGNQGNVKSMKPHCTDVFNVAGFLCVSVSPMSNENQPSAFVEDALTYMRDNSVTYNVDMQNFFLYAYSGGGHTMLRYMIYTPKLKLRGRVKGMISDAAAPGSGEFNWETENEGKPLYFPPYLMMHCTEDKTMDPDGSVRKSVWNIDMANNKRDDDNKILYKWEKWTKDSNCTHSSLLLGFDIGRDSAVTFIENIVAGDDPFSGIPDSVPETVGEPPPPMGRRMVDPVDVEMEPDEVDEPESSASTSCIDVQPPQNWKQNTCEMQLENTDNCAKRRNGIKNDGYCHKTCGVCSVAMLPCTIDQSVRPCGNPEDFASPATTTAASASCIDVQPPLNWRHNTCEMQLEKTNNCAKRRDGTRKDGYCHKTCGVCSVP